MLTGGTAVRLGGADKASIEIAGVTLLERALAATSAASEVVVVGEQVPTSRPVTWTREDPPGGGPAAGLLAGLDAFRTPPDLVHVLAVDMPRVTAATLARLTWRLEDDLGADAALLVDADGRRQPLAGVYRYSSLQSVRPSEHEAEQGMSLRALVRDLVTAGVAGVGDESRDVDTWDDLRDLRDRM